MKVYPYAIGQAATEDFKVSRVYLKVTDYMFPRLLNGQPDTPPNPSEHVPFTIRFRVSKYGQDLWSIGVSKYRGISFKDALPQRLLGPDGTDAYFLEMEGEIPVNFTIKKGEYLLLAEAVVDFSSFSRNISLELISDD